MDRTYINRSQKYECGKWDTGRAIPFLGTYKSKFLCNEVTVQNYKYSENNPFFYLLTHHLYTIKEGSEEINLKRLPLYPWLWHHMGDQENPKPSGDMKRPGLD